MHVHTTAAKNSPHREAVRILGITLAVVCALYIFPDIGTPIVVAITAGYLTYRIWPAGPSSLTAAPTPINQREWMTRGSEALRTSYTGAA
jgi:hypothetical protein